MKQSLLILSLLVLASNLYSQKGRIYNLRNCQGEMRTVTFQSQVKIIWKCVSGMATIREQKVLNLSREYKFDTAFFESQIQKVKKALPSNFFAGLDYLGDWFDNTPEEQGIWFTEIFAEEDKQGNYKVYAAIKILFDGTNAHIDEQRRDPKVKDLIFIFDKDELSQLGQKLKSCPKSGS
ncbi:hypothetical protein FAM09_16865 [Niastella caeni]|uniref:Uncharacterized protein n=1 Tax=Niastella caeni TaxID=2569763 RepID=A0A4S8HS40_9BACT|nr:hypothetical protein [Niastella caeni]THU38347.1 hypothetical protein FAM09_16865 [Niastella caeni]